MSWARWENNEKCHYKMGNVVILEDSTEWERTKMLCFPGVFADSKKIANEK